MKQTIAVKISPFCCSNRRLSRCSCKYSHFVRLLYFTDIGTQAEAISKDLTGALQATDKSQEGQSHAVQSSYTVIQRNKKQNKGGPNFAQSTKKLSLGFVEVFL